MEYSSKTLATGFVFPEGPRWHDGIFWFADILDRKVHGLGADGASIDSFDVPGQPSGIGWLPDGDLLVVSREDLSLYRRTRGQLMKHADLSGVHKVFTNDMVVDQAGRAYVGSVGFRYDGGDAPRSSSLAIVQADGTVDVAATELECPNGTVVSADGKLLIVAESLGRRLTAFDIDRAGRLSGRRVFADLGELSPDGICLDAEGCVWVATPGGPGVVRVAEGGAIRDVVPIESGIAFACVLGGADRRSLFVCVGASHHTEEALRTRSGRIDIARVDVAGSGLP